MGDSLRSGGAEVCAPPPSPATRRAGTRPLSMLGEARRVRLQPDVLILDAHLRGADGIEVAQQLAQKKVTTSILITTPEADFGVARAALGAQVRGIYCKRASPLAILGAIRMVATGDLWID